MRTRSRNVALLLFEEVSLLDVAQFAAVLSVAGRHWNWRPFKLFAAAATRDLALATRDQLRLVAHGSLDECPAPEVVIVPGGYGARRLIDSDEVASWLGRVVPAAELVAAAGYGVLPLARAGLLGERNVAVPSDVLELARELSPSAAFDTTEAWLASDKLLSARTSVAALDVALELVSRLLGAKHAATAATQLGYVVPATRIEGVGVGLGKKPPL